MKKDEPKSFENASEKLGLAPEDTTRRELVWDGMTRSKTLTAEDARLRHELADLAKNCEWRKLLELLSHHPQLVNVTRPDGHTRDKRSRV